MSRTLPNEQAIADRLRQEALAARPAFSEDLHARLCQSIRQCRAEAPQPQPRASISGRLLRWASVAAAACLMIVLLAGLMSTKTAPNAGSAGGSAEVARMGIGGVANAPQKVDVREMRELVEQLTARVDGAVHFAVKAPRWACLDRNVRRALGTPLVSVPCDVLSSLLSMPPPKHPRVPAGRASIEKQTLIQGQVRVQNG